jgi:predicted Zn-dependent protease
VRPRLLPLDHHTRLAGRRPAFLRAAACALATLLAALAPAAFAHGDDTLIIEALSEELAKAPEADLFIRRGELYRHHQEWAKAEADFIAAAKLDPALTLVNFFRARVLLESGAPAQAEPFLARYQATAPDEPEGWYLRAEIALALAQPDAAAQHYAEGIRRASSPRPEHYLRRARILATSPQPDPARILAALEEGIARLGPVMSLVEYAITLEIESRQYDAALRRIAAAMENMPRRERWLVRQGDILVQAGRPREAVTAYRAALDAIEELPERYRDTVPIEKLAADARANLARLSTP